MSASLKVLSVVGSITMQDEGRPGFQRYGVAEGGAMDRFALQQGAVLLGNAKNTAALEMAAAGGTFEVIGSDAGKLKLAVTGAEMSLRVNGRITPWWASFIVTVGDVIDIGASRENVYAYLHISGGFDVPTIMGSRATHSRASFGGYCGRSIKAGDTLQACLGEPAGRLEFLPKPEFLQQSKIRVLWGAQAHVFNGELRERFLTTRFIMSTRRDRMGARLEGHSQGYLPASGLSGISDAVLAGDVQIAGDGVATLLLADRQPTGGYPRIVTVISADLPAVAQLASGQPFTFELVSAERAVAALAEHRSDIEALPRALAPLLRDPADMDDLLRYNLISGVTSAAVEMLK